MKYFKVLFAVTVWGAALAVTKAALVEISPITLVLLRCFFGSAVMFITVGRLGWARGLSKSEWLRISALAASGVIAQQLIQAYALRRTSANHAGWLMGITPLAVALLLLFIFKEKLGRLKYAGFALGFAGTAIVVTSTQKAAGAIMPTGWGDALFLTSSFNWALYVILTGRWLKNLPADKITQMGMTLSFAIMLAVSAAADSLGEIGNLTFTGWQAVLMLGMLSSGLCYNFWNSSIEKLGSAQTASFLYLEPFAALLAGNIMLGETVSGMTVTGGLLILSGVYWINGGRAGAAILKKIYPFPSVGLRNSP